jgi:hypothetical protein
MALAGESAVSCRPSQRMIAGITDMVIVSTVAAAILANT